jgi:VanZ family protein
MKISKWWGPVVAWMLVIFVLSAQSRLPSPEGRWVDFVFEKSAHTFEFAVLGLLLCRALAAGESPSRRVLRTAVLLAWLYALSDEFHQRYVPGRAADWLDVFFDWLGALIGTWSWLRVRRGVNQFQ